MPLTHDSRYLGGVVAFAVSTTITMKQVRGCHGTGASLANLWTRRAGRLVALTISSQSSPSATAGRRWLSPDLRSQEAPPHCLGVTCVRQTRTR